MVEQVIVEDEGPEPIEEVEIDIEDIEHHDPPPPNPEEEIKEIHEDNQINIYPEAQIPINEERKEEEFTTCSRHRGFKEDHYCKICEILICPTCHDLEYPEHKYINLLSLSLNSEVLIKEKNNLLKKQIAFTGGALKWVKENEKMYNDQLPKQRDELLQIGDELNRIYIGITRNMRENRAESRQLLTEVREFVSGIEREMRIKEDNLRRIKSGISLGADNILNREIFESKLELDKLNVNNDSNPGQTFARYKQNITDLQTNSKDLLTTTKKQTKLVLDILQGISTPADSNRDLMSISNNLGMGGNPVNNQFSPNITSLVRPSNISPPMEPLPILYYIKENSNILSIYNINSRGKDQIQLNRTFDYGSDLTLLHGDLYISGGSKKVGNHMDYYSYTFSAKMGEIYMDKLNLVQKSNMEIPRAAHKLVAQGMEHIFALGGTGDDGYLAHCEKYSTITNKWRRISPFIMGAKRNVAGCIVGNRYLYVFGGFNHEGIGESGGKFSGYLERLDTWKGEGEMWLAIKCPYKQVARSGVGIAPISDEHLLVFGGTRSQMSYIVKVGDETNWRITTKMVGYGRYFQRPTLLHKGVLHTLDYDNNVILIYNKDSDQWLLNKDLIQTS